MSKPTKIVVDCSNGDVTEIELTDAEIAAQQLANEEIATIQAGLEAKQQARQSALAKLVELGLTDEEIAAL